MSDDHAYQAISAYSNSLTQTPNIDRIANEGMIFSNACVTNSICAPSRAVILTGKHSHLNGKIDNHAKFDDSQLTFPQLFQKNGYQTAMFGKLHFGNNPKGVDDFLILPGQGDYINPRFIGKESIIELKMEKDGSKLKISKYNAFSKAYFLSKISKLIPELFKGLISPGLNS